jgi:soluble lytic murein transglycosylase-like protein
MPRFVVFALAGVTLLGLSCAVPPTPHPVTVAGLPDVAAPPPERVASPLEQAIADRFKAAHRSGMTAGEIDVVARTIVEEARRHDLDPHLILAVIHVESRYDAYIVSHAGAMGLMQILPTTGEELAGRLGIPWEGPKTLFDPVVNVRLGVAYLRELSDRYGSTHVALAAYNWGPGHIDRRLRRGTPLPQVYPQLVSDAPRLSVARRSS